MFYIAELGWRGLLHKNKFVCQPVFVCALKMNGRGRSCDIWREIVFIIHKKRAAQEPNIVRGSFCFFL